MKTTLLHKSVITTFKLIFELPHLYHEFYAYLEDKSTWDSDTTINAQDFYAAYSLFRQIFAFSVFFDDSESLKPFKIYSIQDIFKHYYMIDTITSDLMDYKKNRRRNVGPAKRVDGKQKNR